MNKLMIATLMASSLVVVSNAYAGSQRVKAETSPFTDNINVTLSGLPSAAAIMTYTDNNDVNISGPTSAANGTFEVQISSNNIEEDGQPTMVLNYNSAVCAMQFNDGPWDYLTFAAGNPPVCSHFTVSQIIADPRIDHLYSFSIQYNG